MKRTIHLKDHETGFIYRNLGYRRKRYPFDTVIQAIKHHKHNDLRRHTRDAMRRVFRPAPRRHRI